jgi:hypothetical protein
LNNLFFPLKDLKRRKFLLSIDQNGAGLTTTSSGAPHSGGVTGGVYKVRERIHRGMLIRDY